MAVGALYRLLKSDLIKRKEKMKMRMHYELNLDSKTTATKRYVM